MACVFITISLPTLQSIHPHVLLAVIVLTCYFVDLDLDVILAAPNFRYLCSRAFY